MKQFQGLKTYKLPVQEIGDALRYIKKFEHKNSYAFAEICLLRNYTVFLFQFGRKSEKTALYELCDSIVGNIDEICPNCGENPLLPIGRLPIFPLSQRIAVRLFVFFYRRRCLSQAAYIFTRI
jgi:hypothetical protein